MTKYVLHGGSSNVDHPDNDSFFREMTLGMEGKTNILLNYFSRKDDEIEKCAGQDKERFLRTSENSDIVFEVATRENFVEQLQLADGMYMRGGETKKLVADLSGIENIQELFKNKTIGGSSAGVYVLAKYYWENDIDELGSGLGVFNIKAFCHYTTDQKDKVGKLLAHGEALPLVTIPDYKWLVFFK